MSLPEPDRSVRTKPQLEAASLIKADRQGALQLAVDRVASAIREGDDVSARYWSLVVKAVDQQLQFSI